MITRARQKPSRVTVHQPTGVRILAAEPNDSNDSRAISSAPSVNTNSRLRQLGFVHRRLALIAVTYVTSTGGVPHNDRRARKERVITPHSAEHLHEVFAWT